MQKQTLKILLFVAFIAFNAFAITMHHRLSLDNEIDQMSRHAEVIAAQAWSYDFDNMRPYLRLVCLARHYTDMHLCETTGVVIAKVPGEKFLRFDHLFVKSGLIPAIPVSAEVLYDGKRVALLSALWHPRWVYVDAYCFLVSALFFLVVYLFVKLDNARKMLSVKVADRTKDLSAALKLLQSQKVTIETDLQEKNILLKEINHRVKNNLNVILSMLYFHRNELERCTDYGRFFDEMHARICAMAAVHDKLYTTKSFSDLDMKSYVLDLFSSLRAAFCPQKTIAFDVSVQGAMIDIAMAVPFGSLINELMTNALKYAYVERQSGHLTVSIRGNSGFCDLTVRDDGPGFPVGFNPATDGNLGLRIIQMFSEQLGGKPNFTHESGLCFRLRFMMQKVTAV